MEITFAGAMGFCAGVKHAYRSTVKLLGSFSRDTRETYILGDLVHNRQVVERLAAAGFKNWEPGNGSLKDSRVIIRTHGETREVMQQLLDDGNEMVDLTCSVVKSVREKAIALQSRHPAVIVIGKKDHPEVRGLVSYLVQPEVVSDLEDVAALRDYSSVWVVAQTTMGREKHRKLLDAILARFGEEAVEALDTICPHTDKNQQASRETARHCDIMLVVGDPHSSNSKRLFEVCREQNENTHFLGHADELRAEWFPPEGDVRWKALKAGITAGASTPDWVVAEIADKVRRMAGEEA